MFWLSSFARPGEASTWRSWNSRLWRSKSSICEAESTTVSSRVACSRRSRSGTVGEIAYLKDGLVREGGRGLLRRDCMLRFAQGIRATDEVVLEATGNTATTTAVLKPYVARVVIADPLKMRLIAEARAKADKIDAAFWRSCARAVFCRRCGCPTSPRRRRAGRSTGARSSCSSERA